VESELVEAGLGEPPELLRVRLVRVEVDVVRRSERRLEETDVVLGPVEDPEGVPPGDAGSGGPDRPGLLEDVLVGVDETLVRVHSIDLVPPR
jgi:hypothetical protein